MSSTRISRDIAYEVTDDADGLVKLGMDGESLEVAGSFLGREQLTAIIKRTITELWSVQVDVLTATPTDQLFLKTYESDLLPELLPTFNYLPMDANGWSDRFAPSADSLVVYVDKVAGNDTTAASTGVYTYDDGSEFTDWLADEGQVAFATFAAAYAQCRNGYPDYVICRSGQVHDIANVIQVKGGRNLSERFIVTYYGDGARPILNDTTSGHLMFRTWSPAKYFCFIGIEGTDFRRVPDHPDFLGDLLEFNSTFMSFNAFANQEITGIIFEDCYIHHVAAISTDTLYLRAMIDDFIIRRCIITDNYSASGGHVAGIFLNGGHYLIEENAYDHNGWLEGYTGPPGAPEPIEDTYEFSHNNYFQNISKSIIRNNIHHKPSSMGMKLTSNPYNFTLAVALTGVETELVVLEDLPPSVPTAGSFIVRANGAINVPITFTSRVGSSFTINSTDFTTTPADFGSVVDGEFNFTNSYDLDMYGNVFVDCEIGISYGGNEDKDDILARFENLRVYGNAYTEMGNSRPSERQLGWSMTCSDNKNTVTSENLSLKTTNPLVTDVVATQGAGVQVNTRQSNNIATEGLFNGVSAIKYSNATTLVDADFVNADADVLTYLTSIGETATYDAFAAKLRSQSKASWDERYTAQAINDYLRKQYALVNNIKILQDAASVSALAGEEAMLFFNVIANTRVTAQWYLAADDSPVTGMTDLIQPIIPAETPTNYYCIAQDEYGNPVTSATVTVSIATPVNKLSDTEDFSTASWIRDLSTITVNDAVAPDGATTVDLITGSTINGEQRVRHVVATTGTPEVMSIYVKPVTGRYFGFRATDNGSVNTPTFDLQEGTFIGGIGAGTLTAFIEPAANGYYRIGVIFQNRTSTSLNFNILEVGGHLISADGLSYHIWGAMLTDGEDLTPYVIG